MCNFFGYTSLYTPQTITNYILGRDKEKEINNEWIGNWSSAFFITGKAENCYMCFQPYYGREVLENSRLTSNTYVRNRIRWVKNERENKSIKIETLNEFPFKVRGTNSIEFNKNYPYGAQEKIRSIPMPSIDTNIKVKQEAVYVIKYKRFDNDKESGEITLKIKYEERVCHYRYDGVTETEGVTNWDQLQKKKTKTITGYDAYKDPIYGGYVEDENVYELK